MHFLRNLLKEKNLLKNRADIATEVRVNFFFLKNEKFL